MVIRILDHVRTASTYGDGEVIFGLIANDLREGRDVEVSFEGIRAVPSAFVNGAFVRLVESISPDVIKARLRFKNSTRHINEMIRSRFDFVTGSPMKEGIYHVRFSGSQDSGEGTVVVKGNSVNGADPGFTFAGRIFGSEDDLTVDIKVTRWNQRRVSIFGNLPEFSLLLTGRADGRTGTFVVAGFVRDHPDLRVSIAGKHISAAVDDV